MAKVQEKELSQYLELFNAKNVEIIVNGLFSQITKLHFVECMHNTKEGKLRIRDNNSSFEIDLSFVYLIEINKKLSELNFYFDNEIKLTIVK